MKQNKGKKERRYVVLACVLMLISMIGARAVQTSMGKVEVKDLRFETSKGYEMSALLYKPRSVSAESKAPAVITCHGMYNNREMQDINLVELSRRGYVVLSIDMFSHGNSKNLSSEEMLPLGVEEALKMLSGLEYVDQDRIGLTGHSMGGMNCNVATQMDNMNEKPLVSALLLNSCFATYQDEDGNYTNAYGNRDVGIIAGQYDEFLFKEVNRDGTSLLAKDFIKSDNAQSFLNFGKDPQNLKACKANTMYTEKIDGKEALRVIYNPAITHPWSHFSKRSAKATIEFFESTLGAPAEIGAENQVWQIKEAFNLLGLLGFALFAANIAIVFLHMGMFEKLRVDEKLVFPVRNSKQKFRNNIAVLLSAIFSAVTFIPITVGLKSSANGKIFFTQNTTFGIGVWAAASGVILLALFALCRKIDRKEECENINLGLVINKEKLVLTVFLALLVVGVSYLWVLAADYFFKTDFRIWVLAIKTFTKDKLFAALMPGVFLFLVYYVANSVSVNCMGYCEKEGKKYQIRNLCLQMFLAVLPVLILITIQYVCLFTTGKVFFENNNAHSHILWLFPMMVLIPAATVISRKLYRETRNPYLPAIINAVLVTLITCANTSTWC